MKTVPLACAPMHCFLAAALLVSGVPVVAQPASPPASPATSATYDFGYRISGHPRARPLQVFDDGQRTFFQFRAGAAVPVILVGEGTDRGAPSVEGPYHVVAGRARHYTLLVSGGEAVVMHGEGAAAAGVAAAAVHGGATPRAARNPADRTQSSYATPRRGDVIAWVDPGRTTEYTVRFGDDSDKVPAAAAQAFRRLTHHAGRGVRVEVHHPASSTSRRLHAGRLRHLVQALSKVGVPLRHVTFRQAEGAAAASDLWVLAIQAPGEAAPGPSPTAAVGPASIAPERISREVPVSGDRMPHGRPVAGNFDFLLHDRTVSATLSRWARDTGYRLDWTAPVDAPVTGELTLDARAFPEAAARVVTGLRASGYPLAMDPPSDRTVRIRHDTGP